ncbi:hypothetical protein OIU92_32425 [Escherichia coli]|nr:hypothetical protein [Escherichia coli]
MIDRVTAQSHSLTLRDAQGETQVVRISSWTAAGRCSGPENAGGRRRATEGDREIPGLRVSGGDRLQVASVSEDAMTVVVPGRAEPATLPVSDSPFTALEAGEWLGGNARAFRQRQCEGFCLRHTDGNGQRHPERSGPQRS